MLYLNCVMQVYVMGDFIIWKLKKGRKEAMEKRQKNYELAVSLPVST